MHSSRCECGNAPNGITELLQGMRLDASPPPQPDQNGKVAATSERRISRLSSDRQARRLFAYAKWRTDFRGVQASYDHREAGCVFCKLEGSGLVLARRHVEGAMGSALQVTLHRVGGPDGAFQWQRQRQGRRPVILVTDPRQGLLLGRPQHAVLHNLDINIRLSKASAQTSASRPLFLARSAT